MPAGFSQPAIRHYFAASQMSASAIIDARCFQPLRQLQE
jgi:hypothetical protein